MSGVARFTVSREVLRQILHLPETSALVSVSVDTSGDFLMLAMDPTLPDGLSDADPTITRVSESEHLFEWGIK